MAYLESAACRGETDPLWARMSVDQKKVNDLTAQVNSVQTQIDSAAAEIGNLQVTVDDLISQNDSLSAQLQDLTNQKMTAIQNYIDAKAALTPAQDTTPAPAVPAETPQAPAQLPQAPAQVQQQYDTYGNPVQMVQQPQTYLPAPVQPQQNLPALPAGYSYDAYGNPIYSGSQNQMPSAPSPSYQPSYTPYTPSPFSPSDNFAPPPMYNNSQYFPDSFDRPIPEQDFPDTSEPIPSAMLPELTEDYYPEGESPDSESESEEPLGRSNVGIIPLLIPLVTGALDLIKKKNTPAVTPPPPPPDPKILGIPQKTALIAGGSFLGLLLLIKAVKN